MQAINGFNSHLNMEQTSKALITLMEIYDKLHFEGNPSQNEASFRAYQILVGLLLQYFLSYFRPPASASLGLEDYLT
jgi:hypothetical protein